jgi:hypothetical protein
MRHLENAGLQKAWDAHLMPSWKKLGHLDAWGANADQVVGSSRQFVHHSIQKRKVTKNYLFRLHNLYTPEFGQLHHSLYLLVV